MSIASLLAGLSTMQWDTTQFVLQDMQNSASINRLSQIQSTIVGLRQRIDAVNRVRESMGRMCENLDALIVPIEAYLQKNSGDLEVELLRGLVISWRAMLKVEIAESRPDALLAEKAAAERKHDFLTKLKGIHDALAKEVLTIRDAKTIVTDASKGPVDSTKIELRGQPVKVRTEK